MAVLDVFFAVLVPSVVLTGALVAAPEAGALPPVDAGLGAIVMEIARLTR